MALFESVVSRRAWRGVAVAAALIALAAPAAHAQGSYPSRPIKMIVPLAAASAVDVAARLLAQKMSLGMGQSIVVENVVGAAGIIGAQQLAKAPADGYTIGGFNDSIITMVPNLNPKTPFNPLTDFSYITLVATIDFSAAVPTDSPYRTIADLVAAAKARPGKVTYASGGNGSPQHIAGALFAAHVGVDMEHVPYRGASQAAQDVAGGQVDVTFQGIATVAALAKAGKLRLIGVPAKQRHPEYPATPTFEEVGVSGFDFRTWFVLTAPPGTPREIVMRLNREAVKALADPEVRERFAALGLNPTGNSPEEVLAMTREQLARYGKVIREKNIRAD